MSDPTRAPDRPSIEELVDAWQSALDRGRDIPAAELCPDHPDLAADLERRIAPLRRVAGLAAAAGPDGRGAPSGPDASRYTLGPEIARGGMGVIYRATDAVLGREVAVKVLQDKFAPGSGTARRFLDEAQITGQLQHPAIPPVHDLGALPDGRPFLAMKLIKGQTLEDLLAARATPADDRGRFLAVFEQVCQAVGYAHAHQVIHRDLKPANVMVGSFGEVQVMDWGLAKVLTERPTEAPDPEATRGGTVVASLRDSDGSFTQAGSVLGTPAFMPPEQAVGAVAKVDARSDVFGLGGILAVVLTGQAPFAAGSAETTRVRAATGDVAECFARLDACGADPELVALAKRCLSPRPADRPADAGEVARAVAELRAAADERARKAELDRVRVEGEAAAAAARAAERRKRRRVWAGAGAALAAAVVAGLGAVLWVQRRANADLGAKNRELADERATVEARNRELADEQAKVQARFELAQKAIATFHTGVSEDALLGNAEFKELRTKLLKQAAGFYADLEKLLAGQTDAKSRKALAAGYDQLGQLIGRIDSPKEALEVHRKALAIRRELAAEPGADVETRLDVARSLGRAGRQQYELGDMDGARATYAEMLDAARRVEADHPTPAVKAVVGQAHYNISDALMEMQKFPEALEEARRSLAVRRGLYEANPADPEVRFDYALSLSLVGEALAWTGKPEEGLGPIGEGVAVFKGLADQFPDNITYQFRLANQGYNVRGNVLQDMLGRYPEAVEAYREARRIHKRVADAHSAVIFYQSAVAGFTMNLGNALRSMHRLEEALEEQRAALPLFQKVADANPGVPEKLQDLALCHWHIGHTLERLERPAEALAAYEQALSIRRAVAKAHATVTAYQDSVAGSLIEFGLYRARLGRFDEALANFDEAVAIRRQVADADAGSEAAGKLSYGYADRGWAKFRAGRPAEAAADLRQAVEMWGREKPRSDWFSQYRQVRAFSTLAALAADPRSGVSAAEAAGFADRAVAALPKTVDSLWLGRMKDPEYDPIRDRPEFQKWFREQEAKLPKPVVPAPPPREKQ